METLKTEHVRKTIHGLITLGPLDIRLDPGEILNISGPPGAGKTTLLRLLWGFARPDEGRIFVFGMQPHLSHVAVRLKTGYLPANPHFRPLLTVKQHLRFTGHFYDGWDECRTDELLEQFRIDGDSVLRSTTPDDRSKIALISALGHRPALLILDQLTFRNTSTRTQILAFLRELAMTTAVSIVFSSREPERLDEFADSVLMLSQGRVVNYRRCLLPP